MASWCTCSWTPQTASCKACWSSSVCGHSELCTLCWRSAGACRCFKTLLLRQPQQRLLQVGGACIGAPYLSKMLAAVFPLTQQSSVCTMLHNIQHTPCAFCVVCTCYVQIQGKPSMLLKEHFRSVSAWPHLCNLFCRNMHFLQDVQHLCTWVTMAAELMILTRSLQRVLRD